MENRSPNNKPPIWETSNFVPFPVKLGISMAFQTLGFLRWKKTNMFSTRFGTQRRKMTKLVAGAKFQE